MNRSKSLTLPYDFPAYLVTFLNFLAAVCLVCVFFYIAKDLPETVPLHYTNGVGFDRWGEKTELYSLAIIPAVTAALNTVLSVILIRKNLNWISYLTSGISFFVTLAMALAAALMFRGALSA